MEIERVGLGDGSEIVKVVDMPNGIMLKHHTVTGLDLRAETVAYTGNGVELRLIDASSGDVVANAIKVYAMSGGMLDLSGQ